MRIGLIAAAVAATVAVVAASGQPHAPRLPHTPVDPARMSHDVRVLSSDAFGGRGPGTLGEVRTIDYLVKRFQALGLRPGGDHGGWTQAVPMQRFAATSVALRLTYADGARTLTQGQEAVVSSLSPIDEVRIDKAPLVFVGYGVTAPERGWDDYKGQDLRGKIAVVLINDPDFENPTSHLFGGPTETYYGRWTYKYEEAVRHGALGALIVHETTGAGYGWRVLAASVGGAQFDLVRADAAKSRLLLQGWLQRDVAVDLMHHAGLEFEALKAQARQADFQPVELKGVTLDADVRLRRQKLISHNVIARLPGVERPAETVLYSAHWDHFGLGKPDASGDRIHHGAVDDGTGLAALLELARLFSQAPPTRRSVVFAAFTGEERGELGAEYYADRPLAPLALTAADLNIDMLQTAGPARDFVLVGAGQDTLEDDLTRAVQAQGRRVSPETHPEAGAFFRGDQFALARVGVPALPLMAMGGGPDLVAGGRAAGEAWLDDYMAHRYHSPQDRWSADWDLRGAALDVAAIYDVGRELAVSTAWPKWKDGSEFAAARAASDRLRVGAVTGAVRR